MRLILTFLLLTTAACRAATGDIISAAVETNGWVCRIEVVLGTNSMFHNGFTVTPTNECRLSSSNNLRVVVTSMGFDDGGNGVQVQRTLYGTKLLRRPYPDEAIFDCITNDGAGIVTARIALSDYIYQKDSNITATLRAGSFVQTNTGSESLAAASVAVTNLSTNDYQKVIGKWSWPGRNRITNDTVTARAVCFHESAQQGRPVRVMRFVCTSTNTGIAPTTNWVLRPAIDRTMPDALPVVEYVSTHDISTVSNGSPLRLDFTAYPWIGDAGACLDTFTDTRTGECAPVSQTNLCDRQRQYWSIAVVASYGNAAGVVSNTPLDVANPPPAFDTVSNAMMAMRMSNGWFYGLGRSNLACGIIYFEEGDHFISSGNTFNQYGDAWLRWVPYPTNLNPVNLTTNFLTPYHFSPHLKVEQFTLWLSNAIGSLSTHHALWLDRCNFDGGGTAGIYRNTNTYFTHCQFYSLKSGLYPDNTTSGSKGVSLIRGCTTWTNFMPMYLGCVVGNVWAQTNGSAASAIGRGNTFIGGIQSEDGGVVAYNWVKNSQNSARPFTLGEMALSSGSSNYYYGFAVVQNVSEMGSSTQPGLWISADDTTNDVRNIICWNNTIVGARINMAYNALGVVEREKVLWSFRNNVADDCNIKTDTLTTANGNRIGNWSQCYSVNSGGNWLGQVTGIGAAGFAHEGTGAQDPMGWTGLDTYELPSGSASLDTPQYVTRAAYDGTTAAAGGGDYRLKSSSPLFRFQSRWVLPYDLGGLPRGELDPPGAYASGNTRKGAFF